MWSFALCRIINGRISTGDAMKKMIAAVAMGLALGVRGAGSRDAAQANRGRC
jgi:hypothetical protein